MFTWNAWGDFLAEIERNRVDLAGGDDKKVIWYRGHGSAEWGLEPTLHRKKKLDAEKDIFFEFQRAAARLFRNEDTDWDVLFDMQHYGVATRLLDWSENPGVAIAFALLSSHKTGDAAIWLLDPLALNKLSRVREIKRLPGDPEFSFQKQYWERNPPEFELPLAISPKFRSERLFAQRGTFTVHGADPANIDDQPQCRPFLRRVVLAEGLREGARRNLRYSNLDEYAIYPDIEGMVQYIKRTMIDPPEG